MFQERTIHFDYEPWRRDEWRWRARINTHGTDNEMQKHFLERVGPFTATQEAALLGLVDVLASELADMMWQ